MLVDHRHRAAALRSNANVDGLRHRVVARRVGEACGHIAQKPVALIHRERRGVALH
jgi:hypothetical protein